MKRQNPLIVLRKLQPNIEANLLLAKDALHLLEENPKSAAAFDVFLKQLEQLQGIFIWLEMAPIAQLLLDLQHFSKRALVIHFPAIQKNTVTFDQVMSLTLETLCYLERYLEHCLTTQKFFPALLIPLFNRLRQSVGDWLLEESAFLAIDKPISCELSKQKNNMTVLSLDRLTQMAKSLRQMYQASLLGLMKQDHVAENLTRLHQVIQRIYTAAAQTEMGILWWLALAAIEAMQTQRIELTPQRLSLLQKLDKPLKALAYEGVNSLQMAPSATLMKTCLYIASLADDISAPVLTQVRQYYDLQHQPSDLILRREKFLLEKPSISVFQAASEQVQIELNEIKKSIEKYLLEPKDVLLQEMIIQLNKAACILMMLDWVEQSHLLSEQADIWRYHMNAVDGVRSEKPLTALLHDLADSLSYVEQTIQIHPFPQHEFLGFEPSHLFELEQAQDQVIHHLHKQILESKHILEQTLLKPDTCRWHELSTLFSAIVGLLKFLHFDTAACIVQACEASLGSMTFHEITSDDMTQWLEVLAGIESYLEMIDYPNVSHQILDRMNFLFVESIAA